MTTSPHPFAQPFEELPNTLPIFPLSNALMLPNGELPLNIFEPRYLNMVQDAMKNDQLIGMIQPRQEPENKDELYPVGCAGRITRYEETHNGRLIIVLSGLCRFQVKEELACTRGYRLVIPKWSSFKHDYDKPKSDQPQVKLLLHNALRQYFKQNEIDVNWNSVTKLSLTELMISLFSYLPLESQDKQLLLETPTLDEQLTLFTAILEGDSRQPQVRH